MEWGWAFDGVNQTIPRNAGPECTRYLTWQRQIIENVVVTSISIFVLHWIWKRLSPCFDPSEEHRAIMEQRLHDWGGGQKGGGGGVKPNLQPPGGYFGNTVPPPLIFQRGNSVKSALLFNSSNSNLCNPSCDAGGGGGATAEVCHSKDESGECRFNVNSGYCVDNSASGETAAAVGGGEGSGTYQQQQQRFNEGELEYSGKVACGIADKIFVGKQVLLVLMTFVLGLELGFKFASRTVIYLLNPCHITTIMQVSVEQFRGWMERFQIHTY